MNAKQRRAQAAARLVILALFLAALGIAGAIEAGTL